MLLTLPLTVLILFLFLIQQSISKTKLTCSILTLVYMPLTIEMIFPITFDYYKNLAMKYFKYFHRFSQLFFFLVS